MLCNLKSVSFDNLDLCASFLYTVHWDKNGSVDNIYDTISCTVFNT